jgi:hypothetical protein
MARTPRAGGYFVARSYATGSGRAEGQPELAV